MAEKNTKSKNKNLNKNSKPKRRFRINKKLDGKLGIIFVGYEDPFLYFPDMMSYFDREEIDNVEIGTEEVPRKDKKGKIKMSFIDIKMSKDKILED